MRTVLQAVKFILEFDRDINHVDDKGETVMHGAAYKHVPSVFEYLAEQGAEIQIWNRENRNGWTPLAITEGVHRGMNIISSPVTEAAVRKVLQRALVAPPN